MDQQISQNFGELISQAANGQALRYDSHTVVVVYKVGAPASTNIPHKIGSWAPRLGLDGCIECGKDSVPHMGKGLCRKCYVAKNKKPSKKDEVIEYDPYSIDVSFNTLRDVAIEDRALRSDLVSCDNPDCRNPRPAYKKEFMHEWLGNYYCCRTCLNEHNNFYSEL